MFSGTVRSHELAGLQKEDSPSAPRGGNSNRRLLGTFRAQPGRHLCPCMDERGVVQARDGGLSPQMESLSVPGHEAR